MIEAAEAAEVRRCEWEAFEFLGSARALISDPSAHEALYDGLRGKISHLVRSDAEATEVEEWRDALARAIALASSHAESNADSYSTLAVRLNVLRDLSADMLAQLSAYVASSLQQQPHFQRCLEVIEGNGGEIARATLVEALGLKEANGTRVLKVLEAVRLIRRRRQDRGTVRVSITAEGRKALNQWRSPAMSNRSDATVISLRTNKIPGMRLDKWSAVPRYVERI